MDPQLPSQQAQPRVYHDRFDLQGDFEVLQSRIASTTDRGRLTLDSERFSLRGTKWTIGTEWAPMDDPNLDLDLDDGEYEVAMDAEISQVVQDNETARTRVVEEAEKTKKKKRSETSVCSYLVQ